MLRFVSLRDAGEIGAVAGYAYASDFRGRPAYRFGAEVTWYVSEDTRGRGIGAALYAALTKILTLQGYRRAFAGITLPNAPSVALHPAAVNAALERAPLR